ADQFTNFGDLLKYLRHRDGLTQRALALRVGYSPSQISRLEQNERPPDAATLAARFVPALRLEPEWAARLLELAAAARASGKPTRGEAIPAAGEATTPPSPLPSFVGREPQIAEGRQVLKSSRLVTLTGPGGSGKTRLALEVAASALEGFADGVWLV